MALAVNFILDLKQCLSVHFTASIPIWLQLKAYQMAREGNYVFSILLIFLLVQI